MAQPGYPGNVLSQELIFRRDLRSIERKLTERRSTADRTGASPWAPYLAAGAVVLVLAVFVGGAAVAVLLLGGFVDLETLGRPAHVQQAVLLAREQAAHWKAAGPAAEALYRLSQRGEAPLVVHGTAQYQAGLPTFPRVFARDSLMAAMLMENLKMLRSALCLCVATLGRQSSAMSGEEEGKVFHELPGVQLDVREPFRTDYNSMDSTALFLVGALQHFKATGDTLLLGRHAEALNKAFRYILRHTSPSGFFEEDPAHSGAPKYALGCTYWKDSPMAQRQGGTPAYPVAFTLVQAQALAALRAFLALSAVLPEALDPSPMPPGTEARMLDATRQLLRTGNTVAVDSQGALEGASTDSLHALWYLRGADLEPGALEAIQRGLEPLETHKGYSTARIAQSATYHNQVIWSFEQGFLHAAAARWGLARAMEVSGRAGPLLQQLASRGQFPERLAQSHKGHLSEASLGPHTQLWTVAAQLYFEKHSQGAPPSHAEADPGHLLGSDPRQGGPRYAAFVLSLLRGHHSNRTAPKLRCFDGLGEGVLNDGRCECADGSDEVSTGACAGSKFVCFKSGGREALERGQVGDGVCDCCDGSDEAMMLGSHCPHSC